MVARLNNLCSDNRNKTQFKPHSYTSLAENDNLFGKQEKAIGKTLCIARYYLSIFLRG